MVRSAFKFLSWFTKTKQPKSDLQGLIGDQPTKFWQFIERDVKN